MWSHVYHKMARMLGVCDSLPSYVISLLAPTAYKQFHFTFYFGIQQNVLLEMANDGAQNVKVYECLEANLQL